VSNKLFENVSALATRIRTFIGFEDFAVLKMSSHELLFLIQFGPIKMY
jgi:hypothetical protein